MKEIRDDPQTQDERDGCKSCHEYRDRMEPLKKKHLSVIDKIVERRVALAIPAVEQMTKDQLENDDHRNILLPVHRDELGAEIEKHIRETLTPDELYQITAYMGTFVTMDIICHRLERHAIRKMLEGTLE